MRRARPKTIERRPRVGPQRWPGEPECEARTAFWAHGWGIGYNASEAKLITATRCAAQLLRMWIKLRRKVRCGRTLEAADGWGFHFTAVLPWTTAVIGGLGWLGLGGWVRGGWVKVCGFSGVHDPMEKMFYTLEETAQKLGKSTEEVREMAKSGQLQEFRDRDKLMFKREHVDLLSGGGSDDDIIPLAGQSGEMEPIGLASSGSATGIALSRDDKDSTGISIFEAEDTDESDPSAVTRVTQGGIPLVDPGEDAAGKSASGSGGLLDLTREDDDSSLGPTLLEDVYGSETIAQQTSVEPSQGGGDALFEGESSGNDGATSNVGGVVVLHEVYDGAGSGLVGGLAIGMIISIAIAAFTVIVGITSTYGGGLMTTIGDNFMILLAVMGGVTLIAAVVGMVVGKRS